MLLRLAHELIQAINHEVSIRSLFIIILTYHFAQLESIEDTKSFRLTCKHMDQALAPEMLHCITVDINENNCEKELRKLQYFAERSSSCRTIQGIKQLIIKELSPGHEKEEELKKCLYKALSSLTTVRTVRCIFHERFLSTS